MLTRAAILLFLMAFPALSAPDYSDGINGEEVTGLVLAALDENGLSGNPQIASTRTYPACDSAPNVTPRHGDWNSVELRCDGAWTRVVRTNAGAISPRLGRTQAPRDGQAVAVLVQSLSKGAIIEPHHISLEMVATETGDQLFYDLEQVIGRRLQTSLGSGRAVQARHLEQDWLVHEGTPLAIVFSSGMVEVLSPGLALDNGQRGDLIRARNSASGKEIRGIVADRNKLVVFPNIN